MPFNVPADLNHRPVAIDGAGALGRRIAAVYVAAGTDVRVYDVASTQREATLRYVADNVDHFRTALGLQSDRELGRIAAFEDLAEAVREAWMVVEAVPEQLDLKREVFGHLDQVADRDAILASNSSSLPTSQLVGNVERRWRVLNTHYQQPPELNAVELMSCGETDESLIVFLMRQLPEYGLSPFWVRRESDGFILNRIWASIKRECLMVVEEGVAAPEDVDAMWRIFTAAGIPPFKLMDRVGLDIVLAIEEHYASVRQGIPDGPRRLLRNYIDRGCIRSQDGLRLLRLPERIGVCAAEPLNDQEHEPSGRTR